MATGTTEGRPLRVAASVGDPNGVGPEVLLKALSALDLESHFEVHVFGGAPFLQRLGADLSLDLDWTRIQLHHIGDCAYPPPWGKISPEAGAYAVRSLERATDFCLRESVDLLVTSPIHKQAAHRAGFGHPGHTEFLGTRCGVSDPSMAFFSERLNVLLATIHVPLNLVSRLLNRELIVSKGLVFHRALSSLGVEEPRIAVCGLNPHASEGGRFGDEEGQVLIPAVEEMSAHIQSGAFSGPIPADTVYLRALRGEFDGVLALYHDQGLIPLKLVAFESAVNATLGLPFVRTSPDHGTAFDLAGQGRADPGSMIQAFRVGARLVRGVTGLAHPAPAKP